MYVYVSVLNVCMYLECVFMYVLQVYVYVCVLNVYQMYICVCFKYVCTYECVLNMCIYVF